MQQNIRPHQEDVEYQEDVEKLDKARIKNLKALVFWLTVALSFSLFYNVIAIYSRGMQ